MESTIKEPSINNMRILIHNELNTKGVEKDVEKTIFQLEKGDFRSAEVKKLRGEKYYRAKLSYADRLLFQLANYNGQSVILVLEVIRNHEYEKSRFLNGAEIDESKLKAFDTITDCNADAMMPMRYMHNEKRYFHLLDKILSFDDEQDLILGMSPPLIVIGSAGSGKTTLVLEKVKQLRGNILYTTLSPYLAQNAQLLYYSHHYRNETQDVTFLSFRELLESIEMPTGQEMTFRKFMRWFRGMNGTTTVKDGHKLFEEFNGVLTGGPVENEFLGRAEYLGLGVRRSIFTEEHRGTVYNLFEKYLQYLVKQNYFDLNIEAHRRVKLCKPEYDFVVVDEVQDLTNTQLNMILCLLHHSDRFILCGDSNQIVHPNFFSWSSLKSMFYEQRRQKKNSNRTIERILANNYRNYERVTALANRLLMIKNARFGSIDKESNYLVKSVSQKEGAVEFLAASDKTLSDINSRTSRSMHTAVLVPREEDKIEAAKFFKTPLLFSIQEAKGLEYPNIVLLNFVSLYRKEFNVITDDISADDLDVELKYSRARDKRDKSLEEYKFFINALYVAITRAVEKLYIVEKDTGNRLYKLLELTSVSEHTDIHTEQSSAEDWQDEANRLSAQGKTEQADAIRKEILETREVEWDIVTPKTIDQLKEKALDPLSYNKKSKQFLFEYAVSYHTPQYLEKLIKLKFNRAKEPKKNSIAIFRSYTRDYLPGSIKELHKKINLYGINFRNQLNQTPLMLASRLGNVELVTELIKNSANCDDVDNWGHNALQIALGEAYIKGAAGINHIGQLYPLLAPSSMKLRIDNRLIKLGSHLMEFFLVQSMLAIFPRILRYKTTNWFYTSSNPIFESGDFFFAVGEFPEYVLPERRKKRSYISSILSKNEVFRDAPYNRHLFLRVQTGNYILNPLMDVFINDSWINVYDLLDVRFQAAEGLPIAESFCQYLDHAVEPLKMGVNPPPFRQFIRRYDVDSIF